MAEETRRAFYCNKVAIAMSEHDFMMVCGRKVALVSPEGKSGAGDEESVTLITSPVHFKKMVGMMARSLEAYEKEFGEIRVRVVGQAKA